MFFKFINQEDWLSPDFLENLTSLEKQFDLLNKPKTAQLIFKLNHLTHAFTEILIKHLNCNTYGSTIRKFSIFADVSSVLERLQVCNTKLLSLLEIENGATKKSKIAENQASASTKQKELTFESTPTFSHKRKLTNNSSERAQEISKLIEFLTNMSAMVNTTIAKFDQDIIAALEELQIIQSRQEVPLNSLETEVFKTFTSVPVLMEAMYRTTQEILSEIKINDDLIEIHQALRETQQKPAENQNDTRQINFMEFVVDVQDVVKEILKKQIDFIKAERDSNADEIETLQRFIENHPTYHWEVVIQLLTVVSNELKKCFTENTEDDQKFIKNIELEINDANLVNQLLFSAKEILAEYFNHGSYEETISKLETHREHLLELKKSFSPVDGSEETLSAKLCDFLIESTEHLIGCLNETRSTISLTVH